MSNTPLLEIRETAPTMETTVAGLLAPGKGILAADESLPFATLGDHRVVLEAMLLKTGMVLSGKNSPQQTDVGDVAEATLRCLRRSVPAAVPGIVFLSGGQSDVVATERLNAICAAGGVPWKLSFSYGRALQDSALKTWKGTPANAAVAQAALHHRAQCNSLAVQGKYSEQAEREYSLRGKHHP